MKHLMKGKEEGFFTLTNHQVDQLKMTDGFNQNHLAKVLVGHIDTYKTIIDNLFENE